jgi:hypothetical protein
MEIEDRGSDIAMDIKDRGSDIAMGIEDRSSDIAMEIEDRGSDIAMEIEDRVMRSDRHKERPRRRVWSLATSMSITDQKNSLNLDHGWSEFFRILSC